MEEITKLRLGDIGTIFKIEILDDGEIVDLSECTEKKIILRKPDRTFVIHEADFSTDGIDGCIQYISVVGELDQAGIWQIQAFISFVDTGWHTTTTNFLVTENLEET